MSYKGSHPLTICESFQKMGNFYTFVWLMSVSPFNNNQSFIKSPLLKWTMKYCFLLVLFLSFFAQHLLAFTLYRHSESNEKNSVGVVTHQQHSVHLSESFPLLSEFTAVEMELEEDDETANTHLSFNCTFTDQYTADQFFYNALVRTRFLRLSSSVDNQPSDPLFVLYHSWKYSIA